MNSSHGSRNVDEIDFSEETREIRGASIVNAVFAANMFVDEPAGHLTIVYSIYQIISTDDITASKDMWLRSILHGVSIDLQLALIITDERVNC